MGQQQLLLIILGVIVVGIAIAVGVAQFGAQSTQANKDGVVSSLINLGANAYQYKIRPSTLGGGSQSYIGYSIPSKMAKDDNGAYKLGTVTTSHCPIVGTSSINTLWSATCTADDTGKTLITFSGW